MSTASYPEAPVASSTSRSGYPADCPRFTGPPLFVTGCNRGGTTILTRCLSAHPEVQGVGRGECCEGQYLWRQRFPDWSRHRWAIRPWRWFLRRTDAHATPERIRFFRQEFHAAMQGDGRMLEKTPANALRIPFINRVYPDCYFIHVLRDGRHTTASLTARRVFPLLAPHQWVGAHQTALADLRRLPPERVVTARYEDLMEEPERVLREICVRCGLAWGETDERLVAASARASLRPVERRWERFPSWYKRHVLRIIGPLQRDLGYPVEE
jgi:hypothetical protein